MALNKGTLQNAIASGFKSIFLAQSNKAISGDESEKPEDVIEQVTKDMARVVADAVESYVKSGDVTVDATIIQVISASPGGTAAVNPLKPAKME